MDDRVDSGRHGCLFYAGDRRFQSGDPCCCEKRHLVSDSRVTFHVIDGADFLKRSSNQFDLIYADAWPGKFSHLDLALASLRVGGIYFIDDLLPQPNWPEGHAPKVPALMADLESRSDLVCTRLEWASGLMIAVKR